jgi:hypothetical protein
MSKYRLSTGSSSLTVSEEAIAVSVMNLPKEERYPVKSFFVHDSYLLLIPYTLPPGPLYIIEPD